MPYCEDRTFITERQWAVEFWNSHIRVGLLVLAGEGASTIVHCMATPKSPNRGP